MYGYAVFKLSLTIIKSMGIPQDENPKYLLLEDSSFFTSLRANFNSSNNFCVFHSLGKNELKPFFGIYVDVNGLKTSNSALNAPLLWILIIFVILILLDRKST